MPDKHTTRNTIKRDERGNIFMIILLGVALFAALAMTVSRGMRGDSAARLSRHEATLAAAEVIDFASRVERGVARVLRKGCSESEVSFENDIVAGYDFSTRDKCKVFHAAGGNISYSAPPQNWFDPTLTALSNYGQWYFTFNSCIPGVGDDDVVDCHTGDAATKAKNRELFAVLKYLDQSICEKINEKLLGSNTIATDASSMFATNDKFAGSFTSSSGIRLESTGGALARCMEGSQTANDEPAGSYHFYNVLMAR